MKKRGLCIPAPWELLILIQEHQPSSKLPSKSPFPQNGHTEDRPPTCELSWNTPCSSYSGNIFSWTGTRKKLYSSVFCLLRHFLLKVDLACCRWTEIYLKNIGNISKRHGCHLHSCLNLCINIFIQEEIREFPGHCPLWEGRISYSGCSMKVSGCQRKNCIWLQFIQELPMDM